MKKFKVFSTAFAVALMLGSCSTNDDVVNGGSTENNQSTQYMAIQIADVNASSSNAKSRASYLDNDNKYEVEDGTTNENAITSIRFYLFDAAGNAYPFATTTTGEKVNYSSPTEMPTDVKTDENPNVEIDKTALLVLDGQTSDLPATIVAVANCPDVSTTLTNGSLDLEDLVEKVAALSTTVDNNNHPLLSNAVYMKDNAIVYAQPIDPEAVQKSADLAKDNPMKIYVERGIAKVRATLGNNFDEKTKVYNEKVGQVYVMGEDGKTTLTDIYASINGMGLANEATQSYVVKNINDKWSFDSWTWNLGETYHRSLWAASAKQGSNANNYSWTDMSDNWSCYTQEQTLNGETYKNLDAAAAKKQSGLTKVMIAGTIGTKNENGTITGMDLYVWQGIGYTSENQLLTYVAKKFSGYTKSDGTALAASDFTLGEQTSTNTVEGMSKNFLGLVQLAGSVTTLKKGDADASTSNAEEVNKILKDVPVKHWKDGATYYYAAIPFDGANEALWGVVRNHIYDLTINTIEGLGTPDPDKDKDIVPETPDDEPSFLYAKLKVLSWRIVGKQVDFTTK